MHTESYKQRHFARKAFWLNCLLAALLRVGPAMAGTVDDLRKQAEQGMVEAQYNLSVAYVTGDGVQTNWVEALKWGRKAADQGLPDAQNNLGAMYIDGYGVRKDAVEAYRWFTLALKGGCAGATRGLEKAGAEMSADQIQKAKRLAEEFKPKKGT